MTDLQGRVVMITGASRGLGAALAEAFARAGARLSICARGAERLRSVERVVRDMGASCLARTVDLADEAEIAAWVHATEDSLGAPAVLINNASLLGPRVPLEEYPVGEWRRVIEVNLTGAFVAARAVLPSMRTAGAGSIINVSSGAAIPPRREWGAYAVSKDAVEGLSLNLAAELAGTGVRVNVVDPGRMRTSMRADAYPDEDPATVKEPAAIAPLFLWLAGDDSVGITGRRFQADEWLERA